MIPGAKNGARWWSSFVCSLSVALFRDDSSFFKEPGKVGSFFFDLPVESRFLKASRAVF